jgi:hypothetical protein
MATQRFTETVAAEKPLRVNKEQGIIELVKCLGIDSKNGRTYSEQARLDASKAYDEVEVNIDHQGGDGPPTRPMADGFGVLRNVVTTKEGVFADLHYLKTHPLADMIVEKAERFPHKFGMSHVALGAVSGEPGSLVVESIQSVESVDIVSRPATVAGLFESEQGANTMAESNKTTVRKVLENHRGDAHAAAFLEFMEAGEFAAVAEAPMEAPAEGVSADEQIKAAFGGMVMAAFDDESLDMKATLARIKDILASQEKLMAKPEKKEEPKEGDGDGPPINEAMQKENGELKRKLLISEGLSLRGLTLADLNPAQQKVLARSETADHVSELIEAWGIKPKGEKPAIAPKFGEGSSEGVDANYLLEELDSRAKS